MIGQPLIWNHLMLVKEINVYMIHSADGASLIRPTCLQVVNELVQTWIGHAAHADV